MMGRLEAAKQQEEIRKQGLDGYRIRFGRYAEVSARGESTDEHDLLSFHIFERFLVQDLGLEREVGKIQAEIRKKYPKWDGRILTHESSGDHVGGGL